MWRWCVLALSIFAGGGGCSTYLYPGRFLPEPVAAGPVTVKVRSASASSDARPYLAMMLEIHNPSEEPAQLDLSRARVYAASGADAKQTRKPLHYGREDSLPAFRPVSASPPGVVVIQARATESLWIGFEEPTEGGGRGWFGRRDDRGEFGG